MIEFICSYYNKQDDIIVILEDLSEERVLIVNETTLKTEKIDALKNMRLDMYCFIGNNFEEFKEVNKRYMKIDPEEIEYVLDECIYGKELIKALGEDGIEVEEI